MCFSKTISVRGRSAHSANGVVTLDALSLKCALGRAGRRTRKREGDGATPIGTWRFVEVFYRADRTSRPRTALPVHALKPDSGWCDTPCDRNYNRKVHYPYAASAERMWRDDPLYNLVVVISHNRLPRVQGAGSAIFIHIARPGYLPTEGCVALSERDLRQVLARASPNVNLKIFA